MTTDAAIVFAILAATLALFIWDRWRFDMVALLALFAAVAAGVVPGEEAFRGFADPVVTTVACVLVLSRAIRNSGALDIVLKALSPIMERPSLQVAGFVLLVAMASGFMNNVGALALFLPLAIQAARKAGRSPSELLMPMSFASLLGGLTTLIGTPPNLLIATVRRNFAGEPFGMFDFAPVGAGIALVGAAFLVVGWRLLPRGRRGQPSAEDSFRIEDYLTEVRIAEKSPLADKTVADLEALGEGDIAVIAVIRNEIRRLVPYGGTPLRPGDVVLLETDPVSLKRIVDQAKLELVGSEGVGAEALKSDEVGVVEAVVMAGSLLARRSLATLRLRQRFGVNLLAIRRSGRAIRQRLSRVRIEEGDVVVLQGNVERMPETLAELGCLPLADRKLQLGRPPRVFLPIGLMALAVVVAALGIAPIAITFLGAVVAIALLRLLTLNEMYDAVDWPVLILLGALIPVTGALQASGGTELIAGWIAAVAGSLPPTAMLAVVMVTTMLVTPVLNNAATVLLMAPIAATLAGRLGFNLDPFLMAVAVGASCDFLTPIGHQSNTLVMGPGGYKFGDYWRLGLPVSLLVVIVGVPLIALVWPLGG